MELQMEQVLVRDDDLVVFFPKESVVEGELVIAPIQAFKSIEELPDILVEKMFHIVNKMSSSLFDILGCHGTNLLIQNGKDAGQNSETLFIRIIPRFENDGLELKWTPKPSTPEDLESTVIAFKGVDEDFEKEKFLAKQKETATKKEPDTLKNDYLIKSLKRNP